MHTERTPRDASRRITRKHNLVDNTSMSRVRTRENPNFREYITTDGTGYVWRTSDGRWAARYMHQLAGTERLYRTLREAAADARWAEHAVTLETPNYWR